MKWASPETRVGLFFLIGLAILGVITFRVGNFGEYFKHKVYFKVHFSHASGLAAGDPVAVAGFKVGQIQSIRLEEDGVLMSLAIEPGIRIRRNAVASIAWGGLLGNRYIDISLGSPSEPFLEPGAEIMSGTTIELTAVLLKLNQAATEIEGLFKETGLESKVQVIVDNLAKASNDLAEGRGTLGKLIGSDEIYQKANAIADDLKKASADISKLLGDNGARISAIVEKLDAAIPEAKDAFASIKRLTDDADSGKGILPALLNDPQMAQDLKNSLTRLRASLDRIEAVVKSAQEGNGLVGKLINDPQIADDVRDAVRSLKVIAQRIETGDNTLARLTRDKDLYDDVKKLLDDMRETLRSVKEQIPVSTFASLLLTAF